MNPVLMMLAQQGLVPMPPARPQGLGTDWGQGVAEGMWDPSVPKPQTLQFPGVVPTNPQQLMAPPQLSPRGLDLGRQMSGTQPPMVGPPQQTLTPEMLLRLF